MAEVLVVDDDRDIRETVRFLLEDAGYTVYEAPDGMPALKRLRQSLRGMVVLLDVNMPGVDGIQVMRAVAAQEPLARRHAFVLVTANTSLIPKDVLALMRQFDVPIIAKPFSIDHLLDVVERAEQRLADAMPITEPEVELAC